MSFRHEALLYDGVDGLLDGTVPFVRGGLERDEPVLVALEGSRLDALRDALGRDAGDVQLVDMGELGRNPGRIISAWHDFLAGRDADAPARGVGEPIWPGRTAAELCECHRHESLLNVAFAGRSGFWLRCPYDAGSLDDDVVETARRTHPLVVEGGEVHASGAYAGSLPEAGDAPLVSPPSERRELPFDLLGLGAVRAFVQERAREVGLGRERTTDLMLAITELATNSLRHGGGAGVLRAWCEDGTLVCEVADAGRVREPLAGRVRAPIDQPHGRGLWLVNHLCDLVQLRSSSGGTVVRVRLTAP